VPVLLALVSCVLWGSADFGGGLLTRRLPSPVVVRWSQGAALLFVGVLALATGAWRDPPGWAGWAVVAGLAGMGGLVCFYAALATGTMGVVSPIAALGAVVPVLAGLLSGERPSWPALLGIGLGLAGAAAAGGPEFRGGTGSRSVLLAVAAGMMFGPSLVCISHGARASTLMTMVGMRATSVAVLGVVALLAARRAVRRGRTPPPRVPLRLVPALAVVGLADVTANVLYAIASHGALLSVVAVLAGLYPVATVVLAALVLRERMRWVQRAGVVVALAGVALLASG
jgi:drug/metabolite transporter (DMT)-like permease